MERDPQLEVDRLVAQHLENQRIKASVERKLQLISAFGYDEYEDGQVIKFPKRFQVDGVEYTYAAIKVEGNWYTSGSARKDSFTWDKLVEWLVSGPLPTTKDEVQLMIPYADSFR